ncbi:MAG: hypothetical protein KKD44_28785 [Proteobacteria bacterium]|nr:hypothetical protein [Pseudomonadota bacterium]
MSDLMKDLGKMIVYLSPLAFFMGIINIFWNPLGLPIWFNIGVIVFYGYYYFMYKGSVKRYTNKIKVDLKT